MEQNQTRMPRANHSAAAKGAGKTTGVAGRWRDGILTQVELLAKSRTEMSRTVGKKDEKQRTALGERRSRMKLSNDIGKKGTGSE